MCVIVSKRFVKFALEFKRLFYIFELDRVGVYLWYINQSHRVSPVFVSHCSNEHPTVSGAINCHLFCFMVPLNAHNKVKLEFEALKKRLLKYLRIRSCWCLLVVY